MVNNTENIIIPYIKWSDLIQILGAVLVIPSQRILQNKSGFREDVKMVMGLEKLSYKKKNLKEWDCLPKNGDK